MGLLDSVLGSVMGGSQQQAGAAAGHHLRGHGQRRAAGLGGLKC